MNPLENLIQSVIILLEVVGSKRVLALKNLLELDMESLHAGFPVAILAPTKKVLGHLKAALASSGMELAPTELDCYKSVTAWSDDAKTSVERARFVVAYSTAEQLISSHLAEAMEHAGELHIPLLFYVARIGRISKPKEFANEVDSLICNVARGSNVKTRCLSDPPRFAGPDLTQALEADIEAFGSREQTEAVCLERIACLRSRQVRKAILDSAAELRSTRDRLRFELELLRSTEKGQLILTRAKAKEASAAILLLGEPLREVDTEELWSEIQSAASTQDEHNLLTAYRVVMKNRISEALELGRKQAALGLGRCNKDLLSSLSGDVAKSRSGLCALIPDQTSELDDRDDAVLEALSSDQQQTLEKTSARCLKTLSASIDNTLLRLIDLLRTHMTLRGETGETKDSPGAEEDEAENADKAEEDDDAGERLLIEKLDSLGVSLDPWLDKTELALLRPQMEADLEGILNTIREEVDLAANRWNDLLSEHVMQSFSGWYKIIDVTRLKIDEQLNRLNAIEAGLDV